MGKKRYHRDESLYNCIQENEVLIFLKFLPLAANWVASNKTLWQGTGRPPRNLEEILICLAVKQYFGFSLRRSIGLIKLMKLAGFVHLDPPCFKTLDNYQRNPAIRPYMKEMLEITSIPTRLIEEFFATDSTGVATSCFSTWYSIRTRKKGKKRDHLMVHVSTGTKLNIVTALDVSVERGRDNLYFREHVKRTANNFKVKEWSGDAVYLCRDNCEAVGKVGGEPWFKLKSNVTSKPRGSFRWKRMVKGFRDRSEEAAKKYHRRSNVESTISAKKRKFGSFVRSKEDISKENEETLSWVAYNFTILGRALYEYGIMPEFAM